MADNVTLPGTGSVVETRDQGSSVERQVVAATDDILHSQDSFTPNSAAYAQGNCFGAERAVSNFSLGTKCVLKRVMIRVNFALTAPIYMYIFTGNPTETFTDKAAMPALGATSIGLIAKQIPFPSFEQRGTSQTLYVCDFEGVDIPLQLASNTLSYAMEIGAAATFGTTKTCWVDFWTKN